MKKMIFIMIATSLLLVSCKRGAKETATNMEELYRTQGIPVLVKVIEQEVFIKELDYSITVSGLREAPVSARVSDIVETVNVRIGQRVNQDQIIVQFPQNNPQANFYQAKAAYDLAEQTWQRMQGLFSTGGISKQDLDGAETQFKVAEANWDAVQQAVHVRAPISGVITDINVRENQKVNPGEFLFTVSQLNRLYGRVWVTETDINYVRTGAEVVFRWNDVEKRGRISNLALSLNRDHNAFAADIEIDNTDLAIRSGVTCRANISTYRNDNAIVVPRNVVQKDSNDQDFIYLAIDGFAIRMNVKVGQVSELNVEITEGLSVGDTVIVGGLQLVQDRSIISVQN